MEPDADYRWTCALPSAERSDPRATRSARLPAGRPQPDAAPTGMEPLADERDRHGMRAHAVARDTAGGVGGKEKWVAVKRRSGENGSPATTCPQIAEGRRLSAGPSPRSWSKRVRSSPRQQSLPACLKVQGKDIACELLQALGHVRLDELLPLP